MPSTRTTSSVGVALARRLRTGTVEVDGNPAGVVAPSGGFKASGIGRENGREGLDAYTEIKSIGLPLEGPRRVISALGDDLARHFAPPRRPDRPGDSAQGGRARPRRRASSTRSE